MTESKVTSVTDFRNRLAQPRNITTPSGVVLKVKRLTAMDYIKEGMNDIPNEFYTFITELTNGNVTLDESNPEIKKNLDLFETFLTITIEKGVLDPPMLIKWDKEKEDTHLLFSELCVEDQKFLTDKITGRLSL